MADGPPMRVTVAYAAPGTEAIVVVDLAPGSTVGDALAASRLLERADVDAAGLACAIHGEPADAATPLRPGDRVELVRPLIADPKEARRRRAQENPLPRPKSRRKPGKPNRPSGKI
jgi:putative ubiquitin-RnfH superfamily antitoxin RatB of RatAB toxin-antitoxin module